MLFSGSHLNLVTAAPLLGSTLRSDESYVPMAITASATMTDDARWNKRTRVTLKGLTQNAFPAGPLVIAIAETASPYRTICRWLATMGQ